MTCMLRLKLEKRKSSHGDADLAFCASVNFRPNRGGAGLLGRRFTSTSPAPLRSLEMRFGGTYAYMKSSKHTPGQSFHSNLVISEVVTHIWSCDTTGQIISPNPVARIIQGEQVLTCSLQSRQSLALLGWLSWWTQACLQATAHLRRSYLCTRPGHRLSDRLLLHSLQTPQTNSPMPKKQITVTVCKNHTELNMFAIGSSVSDHF